MAADYSVRMVGLAELRRDLVAIDRLWGKELGRANQQAASIVVKEAVQRAPRGAHQGGGVVAPISSTITASRAQRAAVVAIGGPRSPHAPVTEFGGTIPRAGASKELIRYARKRRRSYARFLDNVTHVRQQPYLYPAIRAKTVEVIQQYTILIDRLMGRAFHR